MLQSHDTAEGDRHFRLMAAVGAATMIVLALFEQALVALGLANLPLVYVLLRIRKRTSPAGPIGRE
jgi:Flp pilus assembly protein TadB